MTYRINKTDGSLVAEIVDSTINTTATSLTLIGKNVSGYGEFINENFIKVLENFSSTTPPQNPIVGQLWFDSGENRIKVYDGNGFRIGSGPTVSPNPPFRPTQGDFWIDSRDNQLYFYSPSGRYLASKVWKDSQGKSGIEPMSVTDTFGNILTVSVLWNGGKTLGIFSNHPEFTPATGSISGTDPVFVGNVKTGFNASNLNEFKFHGAASTADFLIDIQGNLVSSTSFLSTSRDNITNGTLSITNSVPLILGPQQETTLQTSQSSFDFISNKPLQPFRFLINNNNTLVNPVIVNHDNVVINGNLTVNGQVTNTVGGTLLNLSINTTTNTTSLLANNATANLALIGGKAYIAYKIQTSHASWVRVYVSAAARSADSSRTQGVPPGFNSGVIAEVITSGPETVVLAPAINGFNNEDPPTNVMPVAVTNLSGSSNAITVTITKMTIIA